MTLIQDLEMAAALYAKEKKTISVMKRHLDVLTNVTMVFGMIKLMNNVIMAIQMSLTDALMIVIFNRTLSVKMWCVCQLYAHQYVVMV